MKINRRLRNSIKIYLPILIIAFFVFPIFSALSAPLGISITPLKYDISADPGETISRKVSVTNPNDSVLLVVPEFQDFRIVDERGENSIQWLPADIENPYKMIDWIIISKEPIRLRPRESADISFQIRVPKNAGVGAHYAAIFFKAVFDSPESGVGAVPRVGALILLNVGGKISKAGELLSFKAPFLVNKGPVKFSVNFKNNGTAHFKTSLDVSIKSIFGLITNVASQEKFVYPGVERTIEASWEKPWPVGVYFAKARIRDGEGAVYEKSKLIIGFPYKYIVILAVLAYALFRGFKLFRKKFKIVKVKT